MMIGVYILLFGIAIGAVLTLAVQQTIAIIVPRRPLLAVTARALKRQARRNRADLRDVRPAREQGVHVGPYVFKDNPPRLERVGEPPQMLPDIRAFDEEPTHGD